MRWLTGIEASSFTGDDIFHYPLIYTQATECLPKKMEALGKSIQQAEVFIFTSKQAIYHFFDFLSKWQLPIDKKKVQAIAIGKATYQCLEKIGFQSIALSPFFTQEGLAQMFLEKEAHFKTKPIFWPRSASSRPYLLHALQVKGFHIQTWELYQTFSRILSPKLLLEDFNKIIFTSPSCVKAFLENYSLDDLKNVKTQSIGPVTEAFIQKMLAF